MRSLCSPQNGRYRTDLSARRGLNQCVTIAYATSASHKLSSWKSGFDFGSRSTAKSTSSMSQATRRSPSDLGLGIRPSLTIFTKVFALILTYSAATAQLTRRGGKDKGNTLWFLDSRARFFRSEIEGGLPRNGFPVDGSIYPTTSATPFSRWHIKQMMPSAFSLVWVTSAGK